MKKFLTRFFRRGVKPSLPNEGSNPAESELFINSDEPLFQPLPNRFFIHPSERGNLEIVLSSLRAPAKDAQDLLNRIVCYVAATESSEIILPLTAQDARVTMFIAIARLAELPAAFDQVKIGDLQLGRVIVDVNGRDFIVDPVFGSAVTADERMLLVGEDKLWAGFPYAGLKLRLVQAANDWSRSVSGQTVCVPDLLKLHSVPIVSKDKGSQ